MYKIVKDATAKVGSKKRLADMLGISVVALEHIQRGRQPINIDLLKTLMLAVIKS